MVLVSIGSRYPRNTAQPHSEVPFKGKHMFFYNRYDRWTKILDFVEKTGNKFEK